jgi:hypothetical protein
MALYLVKDTNEYYRWNETESNWEKDEDGPTIDYLLKENNIITKAQYDDLDEIERKKYIFIDNSGSTTIYRVINGVLSNMVSEGDPEATPPIEPIYEFYSPNLIPYDFCYQIAINSLPGNKFVINDNLKNIIKIGSSGVFNMDFGNNPIFSIRLLDNNSYTVYPTIIDIIY